MKVVLALAVLSSLAASRPAVACGVPDFGAMLGDLAETFASKPTPVHTPVVELGGGPSTVGTALRVAVGYGWGERETGFLPGTTLTRVLVAAQVTDHVRAVDVTLGWSANVFATLAFDVGVSTELGDAMSSNVSAGPTARLTLGIAGVGVQLAGGGQLVGTDPRWSGSAQLVVEVMDLGSSL